MDLIYEAFLRTQFEQGMKLAEASDLLDLLPVEGIRTSDGDPLPTRYIARFFCKGLVRDPGTGAVTEANDFAVGIWLDEEYQRRVVIPRVLTWLHPRPSRMWHPNISGRDDEPFICIGHVNRGTPLVHLLHRIYAVTTYQSVAVAEHEALNKDCCPWARENVSRFPIDARPLKRRAVGAIVTPEVRDE
jgi:hypothetical protein